MKMSIMSFITLRFSLLCTIRVLSNKLQNVKVATQLTDAAGEIYQGYDLGTDDSCVQVIILLEPQNRPKI